MVLAAKEGLTEKWLAQARLFEEEGVVEHPSHVGTGSIDWTGATQGFFLWSLRGRVGIAHPYPRPPRGQRGVRFPLSHPVSISQSTAYGFKRWLKTDPRLLSYSRTAVSSRWGTKYTLGNSIHFHNHEPVPKDFKFDVFLSRSAKDNAVAHLFAERSRADGVRVWFDEWALKPGDSIPAKIEEGLEHSRVLVLCMSAYALGLDWAQFESGTFGRGNLPFREELNKEHRFLPTGSTPWQSALAADLRWAPSDSV